MSILIKLAVIGVLVSVAFCSDAVRTLMQYFDVRYLLAMVMVQPLVLASLVLFSVRYAVLIDRPNLSYFAAAKAVDHENDVIAPNNLHAIPYEDRRFDQIVHVPLRPNTVRKTAAASRRKG